MGFKCQQCNDDGTFALDSIWTRDSRGVDIYASYCGSCYYLTSYEGSLNPFRGFRKINGLSDKPLIDFTTSELSEMKLPNFIYDAVIEDKKRNKT